ncbi:MAG: DUF4212 domain-containing protein [Verrucomicrobia bacterium]|nr:DUF4212 domain-containing protein [Verrucomicrobiota bacterium]
MEADDAKRAYWRANLKILGILLSIWFVVSYGFGILLVDQLDKIRIPGTGFKLGFWFAQQGSIYVFVVLIFVYTRYMNKLDHRFHFSEDDDKPDYQI